MILEFSGGGLGVMIATIYLLCHLPAIALLIIGLVRLKRKKKNAKVFLIIAGVYFLVGAGVCGAMLGM